MALLLNLALNVGVSSQATTSLGLDADLKDSVERFVDRQGASWGARVDVIRRAAPAIVEWCEEMHDGLGAGRATVELFFDEFRLLATVRPERDPGTGEASRSGSADEAAARKIAHRYGSSVKLLPGNGVAFAFEH